MPLFRTAVPLWSLLVTLAGALLLGTLLGREFPRELPAPAEVSELREHSGRLTSPLLDCELYADQGLKVLKPFKHEVEGLFAEMLRSGELIDGSVYFRDLENGMWFGINESAAYRPASMLKVPVMIAWFKLAEADPTLLGRKILYPGDLDLSGIQGVPPASGLVAGRSYTVEDLIVRMITESDNNAADLLVRNIDTRVLDMVLHDLDVNVNPQDQDHMITAHAYAGFFRVLFNASYLRRDYSERALEILTRSDYKTGIRAGVPAGVTTATKFGEWGDSPDSATVQLHECGIVYYPGRPYLLAIMTRGKRNARTEELIAAISRFIYRSVDEQQKAMRLPR